MQKILTILAHPDDETFGIGGTLAKYSREGIEVHVAIATDGSAGSVIKKYEGEGSNLVKIRSEELKKASKIIGFKIHKLGFKDSGYVGDPANKDPKSFINIQNNKLIEKIEKLIKNISPDVVITHGTNGEYYHPDHICCSKSVTEAFNKIRKSKSKYKPKKLYYLAVPKHWVNLFVAVKILSGKNPMKSGRNKDIDLTKLGTKKDKITTIIDIKKYWSIKMKACEMHESQGGKDHKLKHFPELIQKTILGKEYYIREYPKWEGIDKEYGFFD